MSRAILAGCAAVLALAAPPAHAKTTLAINAGALRPGSSAELRGASADLMAANALRLVRIDVLWNDVQPIATKPVRFHAYDPMVADLAARGVRLAPVLAYSAKWASSLAPPLLVPTRLTAPPANADDFANYAERLAAHYGRHGSFWKANPGLPYLPVTTYEIWNEENSVAYWHPAPSPSGYATLLRAASTRIHAVDPEAKVMVGGLVADDTRVGTIDAPAYLAAVVASDPGIRELIDAVGLHSYANTAEGTVANLRPLRTMMATLGLNVPIALNEWGAPVGGSGAITEAKRATLMRATARMLTNTDCNLLYAAPYTWNTPAKDPTDRSDWFGLMNYEGTRVVPSASGAEYLGVVRSNTTWPRRSVCKAPAGRGRQGKQRRPLDGSGLRSPQLGLVRPLGGLVVGQRLR